MNTPKYKIIYSEIVRLILTNKWPVGSQMKSENELIKFFGVSRLTVRNALSILENESRIKKSRGKKTLILDRRLRNKSNSEIKDRSLQINIDYTIVDFYLIANHLRNKFTSSKSLYFIKRTKGFINQGVYLISRAYISKDIAGNIERSHLKRHNNLIDLLLTTCEINMKKSKQELKAINLSQKDAKILYSVKNIPAISNTWNFFDSRNNLVLIDQEITIKSIKVTNNYY